MEPHLLAAIGGGTLLAASSHCWAALTTRMSAAGTRFAKAPFLPSPGSLPLLAIGAAVGTTLLAIGFDAPRSLLWLFFSFLLTAGAVADARWGWAPDGIVVPLAVLAPYLAGHDDFTAIGIGFALVFTPMVLDLVLVRFRLDVMTPPDMTAIVLPAIVFGASYLTVGIYLAIALLLLAALRLPALRGSAAAIEDAREHTGQDRAFPGRPGIAFLTVAFPVLLLAILISRGGFVPA
jgi:hypothetical protein